MGRPLDGVRVIEVANYVAVPAAGTLLADLGADVVKIEVPRGEIYRRTRPKYAGYTTEFPENPPFHMDNRGKRSVVLDLTRAEARDALARLIGRAEIFVTNLLPARRRKFGLDPESLLARHPRLVVGAISGYGSAGEQADWPAFDYAAYWARTGLMDAMRDEGVPPSLQRPGVGDHAAAVNLVCGILAALRLRDADGRGRYVETSLLQTGFHIAGNDIANVLVTKEPIRRHDRTKPLNPLWNSYPTAGDRWLLLVMIEADRYWPKLCVAIGRDDLLADERFADAWKRTANCALLAAELERTFLTRTLEAWRPILDAGGLIWAPVLRMDEAIADPQARAIGAFYEIDLPGVEGPGAGSPGAGNPDAGSPDAWRFETVSPPFRIAGTTLGAQHGASALGADAREVLREAGLDEAEIEKLV